MFLHPSFWYYLTRQPPDLRRPMGILDVETPPLPLRQSPSSRPTLDYPLLRQWTPVGFPFLFDTSPSVPSFPRDTVVDTLVGGSSTSSHCSREAPSPVVHSVGSRVDDSGPRPEEVHPNPSPRFLLFFR